MSHGKISVMSISVNPTKTPWVQISENPYNLLTLTEAIARSHEIQYIHNGPMIRVCILRLMLWIMHQSNGHAVDWLNSQGDTMDVIEGDWLQNEEANKPTYSGKHAYRAAHYIGDNNAAFHLQCVNRAPTAKEILEGLLISYMADTPGAKSFGVNGSRSGKDTGLLSRFIIMHRGENLMETLNLNMHLMTDDLAELIMFPYRAIWVKEDGNIVVGANHGVKNETVDPWVGKYTKRKVAPRHPEKLDLENQIHGPVTITAAIADQAIMRSIWSIPAVLPEPTEGDEEE